MGRQLILLWRRRRWSDGSVMSRPVRNVLNDDDAQEGVGQASFREEDRRVAEYDGNACKAASASVEFMAVTTFRTDQLLQSQRPEGDERPS